MHANISWPRAARADSVQQRQLTVLTIDLKRADGALFLLAPAIGFVSRVESRTGRVQGQTTRASAELINPCSFHRTAAAIHFEQMNPAPVAGWQQRVLECNRERIIGNVRQRMSLSAHMLDAVVVSRW